MFTRSRLLLSAGFVAALAVGTFLTPSSTCATIGGCLFPSFAVSQFLNTVGFDILVNLSPNENRCLQQCGDLYAGCMGVANAAERCSIRAATADLEAEERGCADGPLLNAVGPQGGGGGPIGECKKARRNELEQFARDMRNDRNSAEQTCANAREDCESDCFGDIKE